MYIIVSWTTLIQEDSLSKWADYGKLVIFYEKIFFSED